MDAPIHVLLVDDEPGIRHVLGALIKDFGYDAHTAESAREALEAFAAHPFPIVVTDVSSLLIATFVKIVFFLVDASAL